MQESSKFERSKGPCQIYGFFRTSANGVQDFHTHKQWGSTFLKNVYRANVFFNSFSSIIFYTGYYLC